MEPGKWLKAYSLCKVDGGVGECRRSQMLKPDSSRKQCFSIVWEQGSVNLAAMGLLALQPDYYSRLCCSCVFGRREV